MNSTEANSNLQPAAASLARRSRPGQVTQAEFNALLKACDVTWRHRHRNRALLILAASYGLGSQQLSAITPADLHDNTLTVRHKNGERTIIELATEDGQLLKSLVSTAPWLFTIQVACYREPQPLSVASINATMRSLSRLAKINPEVSLQTLRRGVLANLFDNKIR